MLKYFKHLIAAFLLIYLHVFLFKYNTIALKQLSVDVFGYKMSKQITFFVCEKCIKLCENETFDSFELCFYMMKYVNIFNVMLIKDSFNLFRNKMYNDVKKRYDTIHLEIDQVIIVVILFCFLLHIYANIAIFYVYFAGIHYINLLVYRILFVNYDHVKIT
ncbi:hypothetical protein EHP00_1418 [Ecytonucleospora hepatopenaei]|uniref:Uncharacterized protein n=1 Tax=Ecytonucleospora hepatopenaei TaxID=646526 RepID=A0A1W0E553_9MICR|nr:hypothetical protein EHP00_1418 [Ecytonucleospora hepatopenaei]